MTSKYDAMTVAKWFVAWATAEDADLSNLKLQKLLYYAQGWSLNRTGDLLFSDRMRAWSHGPVVPTVYHEFKHFGSGDIALDDGDSFTWDQIDDETTSLLIEVWNTYGGFGAWRLRNMTHSEPPWRDNFEPDGYNVEIPVSDIAKYFKSLSTSA